jgi:hypothetical protein
MHEDKNQNLPPEVDPPLAENPNQDTPLVSMIYDDALPEALASKQAKRSFKPQVKTGAENLVISPYVIHLSNGTEVATPAAPSLDALAASLFDEAIELDAPLVNQNVLEVSFDDVTPQLSIAETHLSTSKGFVIENALQASHNQAPVLPMAIELTKQDRVNLYEELLPQIESLHEIAAPAVLPVEEIHEEQGDFVNEDPAPSLRERFALPRLSFSLPGFAHAQFRAVAAFVVLSFAVVLPLQAMQGLASSDEQEAAITNAGKAAIDNFLRASAALEENRFDLAASDFKAASAEFATAEASLNEMNLAISTIIQVIPQTDKSYDTVLGLITAGGSLADAAAQLATGMEEVSNQKSTNIITKMRQMSAYVETALPDVLEAEHALKKVDVNLLPKEYQEAVAELKDKTPAIARSMQEFLTFSDTLAILMGEGEKMRYLVTFQNNTELRATGGFVGSFAEMDVLNGEITNVHIPAGGTYDLQGQLSAFVASPEPLSLIDPRWEFHDSNWFPDFPSSAKKMLWFYEKAGGPTVDGVLAINASMIPKLLDILGPIEMPDYGLVIDSENFLFETQKIVDLDYAQYVSSDSERVEDAPKQFIGDLAPVLLERMKTADSNQLLAIVDVIGTGLSQKDVQMYFTENELQSHIENIGWAGKQKQTSGDYLMVVNTNLGGGKTDSVIDQRIDVTVDIGNDGRIINTVTITKEHRGIRTALFEGLNNVDYIRLYLPRGSRLIEASGFEIPAEHLFEESDLQLYMDDDLAFIEESMSHDPISQTDIWEENGKTVFGNWMQTAPGEIEEVSFSYELPFTFKTIDANPTLLEIAKSHLGFKQLESYTMLIQKQSGVQVRDTFVNINWPDKSKVVWTSQATDTSGIVELNNDHDNFLRFLVENSAN